MKKLLIFIMIACYCRLQGQFVDFKESVSKNKFLGLGMSACSTETNHSKKNYQKGYDCGNGTISQLLNLNFLSPENIGQQFYIFNDFMYWMSPHNSMGKWNGKDAKDAKKQADAVSQPDALFGAGVFMIAVGTSPYLQQIARSDSSSPSGLQKTCADGQTLLVAQLKYNNGNSLNTWSQDSICLAPTDSFEIQVSSDVDTLMQTGNKNTKTDNQGIDWMKDSGPKENYQKAGSSPRKVKLVLKNSPAQAVPEIKEETKLAQ